MSFCIESLRGNSNHKQKDLLMVVGIVLTVIKKLEYYGETGVKGEENKTFFLSWTVNRQM